MIIRNATSRGLGRDRLYRTRLSHYSRDTATILVMPVTSNGPSFHMTVSISDLSEWTNAVLNYQGKVHYGRRDI